ncbi:MAG: gfo/Idh/MocA family oxidoreductase [Planctomycetota bacterium]|nr:MAG: gfo/Idh/MocA family oxidoreductase [Planctomycetota bacterium]
MNVKEKTMTKEYLRWGIIGCGNVCERKSGPPLQNLPHCRLLAVTRRDPVAGRDFAQRFSCDYEPSIESLLQRADIDAVYIASPDALHHEHTLACAAAGKMVLVEKAMASNAQQCDAMIAACQERDLPLAVAYYRRCYPSILRAQQLLEEGAIGRPQRLWMNDQFPTSHRIDLAHFFFADGESVRVDAGALPPDSHADHGNILQVRHGNGAVSVMNVDWRENHDVERVIIDGSAGRLVIDDLKAGRMWLIDEKGKAQEHHQPPLPWTHQGLMDQVAACFLGRATNPCDGQEGRKSTVILDAIAQAVETDGWCLLDYRSG